MRETLLSFSKVKNELLAFMSPETDNWKTVTDHIAYSASAF